MQNYWKKEQMASFESILSLRPKNLENQKYLRLRCFPMKLVFCDAPKRNQLTEN